MIWIHCRSTLLSVVPWTDCIMRRIPVCDMTATESIGSTCIAIDLKKNLVRYFELQSPGLLAASVTLYFVLWVYSLSSCGMWHSALKRAVCFVLRTYVFFSSFLSCSLGFIPSLRLFLETSIHLDVTSFPSLRVFLVTCAEKIHQASAAALRAKKQLLHKAKAKTLPVSNNVCFVYYI